MSTFAVFGMTSRIHSQPFVQVWADMKHVHLLPKERFPWNEWMRALVAFEVPAA